MICEKLVNDNTPQAFLWHTSQDGAVNVENSLVYAAALRRHKIPFELHIYPFGAHGLATVDNISGGPFDEKTQHSHEWINALRKWVKLVF